MRFGWTTAGRGVWIAAAAWQVAALSLQAQDAAATTDGTGKKPSQTLDTVVVQDVPVDQNILPTGPTSSVYGLGTSIQDTPRVVNQINASQLRDGSIQNPNDFIYYTPGLTRQASQGDPVQPFIRGQAGQTYINGFLAGTSGSWLGPGFSNNALDHADIVAGPASVIFGPSPLTSGYINYVTKQGYFDKFHGSVQTDFGSWVSGGASYPNFKQTIDVGAPIIKDELAYRVSVQKQEADGFYNGTENNYNDVYAAINWIPNKDLEIDYNIQWKTTQQLYTSGWNRRTQDLESNNTYLAGPAIPIIRLNTPTGGVSYYSPVLNANRQVVGYVARAANTATQRYTAGAAFDPNAAYAANNALRGQVVGYVLDPALTTPTHVYANETNADNSGVGADWEVHQQARVKYNYNDDLTLLNESDLDLGSITLANSAGPSNYFKQAYFENRLHAQLHEDYNVAGLDIDHQSDSGIAFRYENTNNDAKTVSTTNAWGDMLYSPNANANLGGAQVIGGPNSNGYITGGYFGNLPTAWAPKYNSVPYGNYLATPGSAFQDWDAQTGIFSQHNVKFGDQWGLNVGGRVDALYVHVDNPITAIAPPAIAGATATSLSGGDQSSFLLPQINSSLTYKPVPWTTTYLTFDYGQAYNQGNGSSGNFSLTGVSGASAGTLAPGNFHSASLLYEAGAKFEFIPNQLFGSIAGFYQERSQFNTLTNTSAPLEAHGVDVSVRYQPAKAFNMGVNGELINVHYSNYSFSSAAIYSANGIVADNATLFGSNQFTNVGHNGVGNYRVPNIPDLNVSAFADYKFDFGLGFTARYWWASSAPIDVSNTVIVPDQWNLDLGAYYERPRWRAEVDLTNATDNRIFLLNGTGFFQEAPIGVSGRVRFTF